MATYPITLLVLASLLCVLSPRNWRTGLIRNAASATILAGGIASIIVKAQLAAPPDDRLFPLSWGLMAVGLLVAGVRFGVGLGVAKLLIAMLPWMQPVHFLWMITVFGFAHFALAKAMSRYGHSGDVPAVPGIAFAVFVVAIAVAVMR